MAVPLLERNFGGCAGTYRREGEREARVPYGETPNGNGKNNPWLFHFGCPDKTLRIWVIFFATTVDII